MKISEFELISRIQEALTLAPTDLLCGIGDDCAVVKKDSDHVLLMTSDCLVENVHFDLKYFSYIELGKKAMAVNLSDIAAMGGVPRFALVTIGVPLSVEEGDVLDLYTGFQQVGAEFATSIVGGDTSSSSRGLFINLTVLGTAKNGQYKLRSAARPGDGIYVTGNLGSAALGLRLLQKKKTQENNFIKAHKNPRPRLNIGQILGGAPAVHAMIDLSDGLLQDLTHVLKASGVNAEIHYEHVPHEDDFFQTCKTLRLDADETLLAGGEDYQLLFTMDETRAADVLGKCAEKRFKVTRIGTVTPRKPDEAVSQPWVRIFRDGKEFKFEAQGFDHFRK